MNPQHRQRMRIALVSAIEWNVYRRGPCTACRQEAAGPRHRVWVFNSRGALERYLDSARSAAFTTGPELHDGMERFFTETDRFQQGGDFQTLGLPFPVCRACAVTMIRDMLEFMSAAEPDDDPEAERYFGTREERERSILLIIQEALQHADEALMQDVSAFTTVCHLVETKPFTRIVATAMSPVGSDFDPMAAYTLVRKDFDTGAVHLR